MHPDLADEIELYCNQVSVPCRAVQYLKHVWFDRQRIKTELDRLNFDAEDFEAAALKHMAKNRKLPRWKIWVLRWLLGDG